MKEIDSILEYIEKTIKHTNKKKYGKHIKYYLDEKIFAILYLGDNPHIILKANGRFNKEFRKEFKDTVYPSYAINQYHWNSIILNRELPAEVIFKLIDMSIKEVMGNMTRRQKGIYDYILNSIN